MRRRVAADTLDDYGCRGDGTIRHHHFSVKEEDFRADGWGAEKEGRDVSQGVREESNGSAGGGGGNFHWADLSEFTHCSSGCGVWLLFGGEAQAKPKPSCDGKAKATQWQKAAASRWPGPLSAQLLRSLVKRRLNGTYIGTKQKAEWAVEVKWSDRYCDKPHELESLISFCRENSLEDILVTSRTKALICNVDGIKIPFVPASVYCYAVGYNIVHARKNRSTGRARPRIMGAE